MRASLRWNWRCEIFSLKIRRCNFFDKFHVCPVIRKRFMINVEISHKSRGPSHMTVFLSHLSIKWRQGSFDCWVQHCNVRSHLYQVNWRLVVWIKVGLFMTLVQFPTTCDLVQQCRRRKHQQLCSVLLGRLGERRDIDATCDPRSGPLLDLWPLFRTTWGQANQHHLASVTNMKIHSHIQ